MLQQPSDNRESNTRCCLYKACCWLQDGIAAAEDVAAVSSGGGGGMRQDMYQLKGIVVHSGTAFAGHYYSYIQVRRASPL